MPLLFALTVSIGLLAVVATWLFLGPLAALGVQIWQAFVAWASFYNNGGKTEGATKTAVCMTFGAVVGMLSVMLAGQLGRLGALAAPVAVGIGAAVIVLAAHLPAAGHHPGLRLRLRLRGRPDPAGQGHDAHRGDRADHRVDPDRHRLRLAVRVHRRQAGQELTHLQHSAMQGRGAG
jgi:hypothetical protein